jgi:hypothetical protein
MLRRLEAVAASYGPGACAEKLDLLRTLERRRLRTAQEVLRLHEVLIKLRAYPDDRELLGQVEGMLASFAGRGDLRASRHTLEDSGVAGTVIRYRFFWPMARWVAARWPDRLFFDWDDPETVARIGKALPAIVTPAEAETLERTRWPARRKMNRVKPAGETDATFLVRGIESSPGDDRTRESFHDAIDAAYRVDPGPGTPSRTHARHAGSPVVFRSTPPSRSRPDLLRAMRRAPRRVRNVPVREARSLIDLACEAMVTRSRDLEAFGFGDPKDVRIVDDGDGLEFVCIGVTPARRRLLHGIYGYLTLRNGVPIGYVQADPLMRHAAISYNTFDTFRGGEAAYVFGRVLAATRALFDARSFSIEPYQLGCGNAEGLDSGAWWFYYKLGFRPRAKAVLRVLRLELARMKRDPGHRSTRATLEKLAASHLFFGATGSEVPAPPWGVGFAIADQLAARSNRGRASAERLCSLEVAELLGVRTTRGWSVDERRAWRHWSPLVLALPGLSHWSTQDRRALVRVVRAKGGRRDGDFVRRFDAHPRLGRAVLRIVRPPQ